MSIKKSTETASCLTAREYKGLANGSTCVCAVATPARATKKTVRAENKRDRRTDVHNYHAGYPRNCD